MNLGERTTIKIGDVVDRTLPALVQDLAQATLDRTAKTTVVVGDEPRFSPAETPVRRDLIVGAIRYVPKRPNATGP